MGAAQSRQIQSQLAAVAYVPVRLQLQLQQLPFLYFLDEVGLELLIVLLSPIDFQLPDFGERRDDRQWPVHQELILCFVQGLVEFRGVQRPTFIHLQFDVQTILFSMTFHFHLVVLLLLSLASPLQDQRSLLFDFAVDGVRPKKILGESFAGACGGNPTFDFAGTPERIGRVLIGQPGVGIGVDGYTVGRGFEFVGEQGVRGGGFGETGGVVITVVIEFRVEVGYLFQCRHLANSQLYLFINILIHDTKQGAGEALLSQRGEIGRRFGGYWGRP